MFNKRTFNHLARLYHSVNFINFWVLVFELLLSRARVQIPFQISSILLAPSKQLINVEATLKFKMKILRHARNLIIYIFFILFIYIQQRVLKTFPGPGYLRSEDGVVWLWYSLVNLYIYIYIYMCIYILYIYYIYNIYILSISEANVLSLHISMVACCSCEVRFHNRFHSDLKLF